MSALSGLLIAVFAVSWSSIFIRWCGDTPALIISFYRMFWSTLLLFSYQLMANPAALSYRKINKCSKKLMIIAGVLLAFHFATWIASIQLTTISHSLVLESTHPVFALIISPIFLKEKGGINTIFAAIITLAGIIIITGQDLYLANGKFLGDLLALAGALFVSFYILIARHQRSKIELIPYLIAVYGMATLVLLFLIIISGYPLFDYPLVTHFVMILLAVIPTGIGHSLINWAARKIEIYKVNFTILGEPVIASLLAFLIFGEKPYGIFYLGAAFILVGIILVLIDRSQKIPNQL